MDQRTIHFGESLQYGEIERPGENSKLRTLW